MIQRIYIDTSVIGGYLDQEFEEFAKMFFERVQNHEIVVLYSSITEEELVNAPNHVKEFIHEWPEESVEFLEVSDESADLAAAYLKEGVVGKTSYADCLHIALASIMKNDTLQKSKHFDAVQFMRSERDRISRDIAELSKEEIVRYFKNNIPKERILPGQKSVSAG
jgi:predicted nucleic acid-binding protein